jgi:hypothetical protein
MTKEIKKIECKSLAKEITAEEMKEHVFACVDDTIGTLPVLKRCASKWGNGRKDLEEKEKQKMLEEFTTLSFAFGVENGHTISSCVNKSFQMMAVEMKKELEKEFDCKNYSEKALVDLAVNGYVRVMCHSWKMDGNQAYIGQKYDSYRNYLSHEIDRSHRHYISAIETLKFLKQPTLKVNIKTNNAFVSENQQFNNHQNQNNEAK